LADNIKLKRVLKPRRKEVRSETWREHSKMRIDSKHYKRNSSAKISMEIVETCNDKSPGVILKKIDMIL